MKRLSVRLAATLSVALAAIVFCYPASSLAFTSTAVTDDMTFDNTASMNASQIDTWLNTYFPSSCISTNNGFSSADPTGYTPSAGFTYGGPVSAGNVIYDAAAAYSLNPQVLLTTLQKEQSLVSGSAGCAVNTYAKALGYGCPDSGGSYSYTYTNGSSGTLPTPLYYMNGTPVNATTGTICVNSALKAGFSEQVIHAAWLFKFAEQRSEGNVSFDVHTSNFPKAGDVWNNSDDPTSCYSGPMTSGTFQRCPGTSAVYYDGYTTIDGVSTHMDNGATAALYDYTPHFSGNQNYDTIFNQYFGSQFANDTFTPHPDGTLVSYGGTVYIITDGTRQPITAAAFEAYNYSWSRVKTASTGDVNLPVGSAIDTVPAGSIFTIGDGKVYVADYFGGVLEKQWLSAATFESLGYSWNQILAIPPNAAPATTVSGYYASTRHPAGALVKMNSGVYLLDQTSSHYLSLLAFNSNSYAWNDLVPATAADIALPVGVGGTIAPGTMLYSGGNIYVTAVDSNGVIKRPVGPWECYANRLHYTTADWYAVSANDLPTRTGGLFTC